MVQPSIILFKLNILVLVCVLAKSLKINMMSIVMYSNNKVTIMNKRHPQNHNLTLHTASQWQSNPLLPRATPYIGEYLASIESVINDAVNEHPRSIAIRCDLRFPIDYNVDGTSSPISKFIASLKAQMEAADQAKHRANMRVHPSTLRYVWVREWSNARLWHYHVVLFLNKDRFFTLGRFKSDPDEMAEQINLSDRIQKAWASALSISLSYAIGLVHFPQNPTYFLDCGSSDFGNQYASLYERLSYFAKEETKHYGDGKNNFGCSRSRQRI